jgi:hypothetical protein
MAQAGFTPIQLYFSTTATNIPSAANLTDGELAINIPDGKLYYKDGGTVKIIASSAVNGTVTAVSVVSANGFAGTVATSTTTPAITLTTTITGILSGNGTAISAASTTGSGSVVLATSPILVTPELGTPTSGTLTSCTGLPLSTGVTGTLPIANGGTGTTSTTFTNLTTNVTGTLPVANGGTGQTSYTDGQLLIGNSTGNTLTKATLTQGSGITITNGSGAITIAAVNSGTVTDVTFTGGLITVATSTTTPALTVAGTSGGIVYFSSASTWASSAALAASAIVLGGGAGAAPATTTTGTGVVTAIGSAVNTTGGLVTQSGTLAASALLLGGGSAAAITSTTTGAGVVTALGIAVNSGSGGLVTNTGTATLTNKRITARSLAAASATGTVTPDSDLYDQVNYLLTGTVAFAVPSGTATNGQKLNIRLYAASAQTVSWTTTAGGYRIIGTTLPTTVAAGKTVYVGCVYNSTDSFWDVVAVATQA